MAIKSSFVFVNFIKFLGIFLSSLFLISCASLDQLDFRPSSGTTPQDSSEVTEEVGKNVDTGQVLGRREDRPFRPKLAVILGPGLSRAFAHIGVLKRMIEADIPVQAVVGLGWGSIAAYEYSSEGSVHGLEWRLSRSKELEALTKTNLWSSEVKPKAKTQTNSIVSSLMPSKSSKGPLFGCSLMSGVIKKVRIGGKKNISDCISVPPVLDSGSGVAPYLMDVSWVSQYLKSRGIEKVIFINVLSNSSIKWGPLRNKMRSSEKWYWNFVENSLSSNLNGVDHTFNISTSSYDMLDFTKTLDLVRVGYKESGKIIKFLQTEYQF